MKKMLVGIVFSLFSSSLLMAWGSPGHRAIAVAAQKYLAGTTAGTKLKTLLGPDWTIEQAATWPDDLKQLLKHQGALLSEHTAESNAFNHTFPNNREWHFVDIPLGADGYMEGEFYTANNDILHMMAICLNTLNPVKFKLTDFPDAPTSPKLTQQQAVRFLIHLAGDLHQPLHVASGYYKAETGVAVKLIKAPAAAHLDGVLDDVGGNDLFFSPSQEFHAYWDTDLVKDLGPENSLPTIIGPQPNQALVCPTGSPSKWPVQWASDSLREANKAYNDLSFNGSLTLKQVHGVTEIDKIDITKTEPAYKTKFVPDTKKQLQDASQHLACLLKEALQ